MDAMDSLKLNQSNQSSSLDDQMEMMLMMMQLPELSSSQGNNELANFHPPKFYGEATTTSTNITHTTMPLPNSLDDNYPLIPWSSLSFTNNNHLHLPSSTTSFTNNNPSTSTTTPMIIQQHDHHQTPSNVSNAYAKVSPEKQNYSMDAMREMIYRMAAMQPIHIDPESVKPPKRRNVKISKDPQSVAARNRRERISERMRILQRLVPGGTKMDTASMLDEAIHYVKFLKTQVRSLERVAAANNSWFPMSSGSTSTGTPYFHLPKSYQASNSQVRCVVEDLRDA